MYVYYIPPPLTVHFSMTRSVRYQPILHTLYYTLHTEHAYCLSYRFLNNVVITTVIEMVELVEILDGRLGKRSVERVRYVIGRAKRAPHWDVQSRFRVIIYYIPPPLTVHFSMTRSVRYQPILHTLYYTLHTEHAYCLVTAF